jgi:hypothetical protein
MKNLKNGSRRILFVDGGEWEYDRFELIENNKGLFFIDLECEEEERKLIKLEKFDNLDNLIKEGKELGFFDEGDVNYFYYEIELEDEMFEWLLE